MAAPSRDRVMLVNPVGPVEGLVVGAASNVSIYVGTRRLTPSRSRHVHFPCHDVDERSESSHFEGYSERHRDCEMAFCPLAEVWEERWLITFEVRLKKAAGSSIVLCRIL